MWYWPWAPTLLVVMVIPGPFSQMFGQFASELESPNCFVSVVHDLWTKFGLRCNLKITIWCLTVPIIVFNRNITVPRTLEQLTLMGFSEAHS